jgi:hypothetical protein
LFRPAAQLLFLPFLFWHSPTGPSPSYLLVVFVLQKKQHGGAAEATRCHHLAPVGRDRSRRPSPAIRRSPPPPGNLASSFLLSLAHRLSLLSKPAGTRAARHGRCLPSPFRASLASSELAPALPCLPPSPRRRNRLEKPGDAAAIAISPRRPELRRHRLRRHQTASGPVDLPCELLVVVSSTDLP